MHFRALFPCGDSMVCIIDDREDVWNFAPNLIHVKPYRFFQGTADINAPPGLSKTEHDSDPMNHKVTKVQRSNSKEDSNSTDKKDKEDIKVETPEKGDSPKGISDDIKVENVIKTSDDLKCESTEESTCQVTEATSQGGDKILCEMDTAKPDIVLQGNNDQSMEVESKGDNSQSIEIETKGDNSQSMEVETKGDNSNVDLSSLDQKDGTKENVKSDVKFNEGPAQSDVNEKVDSKDELNKGTKGNTDSEKSEINKGTSTDKDNTDNVTEDSNSETNKGTTDTSEKIDSIKVIPKEEEKKVTEEKDDDVVEEIEWDDEDDYLLYLEEILTTIHTAFYELHDQTLNKTTSDPAESPDIRKIIPYVKKKVLKGANIVFSGVFPTNIPAEKSRAYIVATALGATVQSVFVPDTGNNPDATTHVVAAMHGTAKVRSAQKHKNVKLVNPNWLWSCNERYERVDERLFLLPDTGSNRESPVVMKNKSKSEKRKNEEPAANQTAEKKSKNDVDDSSNDGKTAKSIDRRSERFSDTYNPLFAFSDNDLACMDREVEDLMDDDEDDSDEDDDEREARLRGKVLSSPEDSTSEDSLTGELPRGWNIKRNTSKSSESGSDHEKQVEEGDEDNLERYEKTLQAFAPDESASDDGDSVGSVDDEMAEAVEKELLAQFQ